MGMNSRMDPATWHIRAEVKRQCRQRLSQVPQANHPHRRTAQNCARPVNTVVVEGCHYALQDSDEDGGRPSNPQPQSQMREETQLTPSEHLVWVLFVLERQS